MGIVRDAALCFSGNTLPFLTDPIILLRKSLTARAVFLRMTDYPLREVVGRNCRFLQEPTGTRPGSALLRAALRAGKRAQSSSARTARTAPFREGTDRGPRRSARSNGAWSQGTLTSPELCDTLLRKRDAKTWQLLVGSSPYQARKCRAAL